MQSLTQTVDKSLLFLLLRTLCDNGKRAFERNG